VACHRFRLEGRTCRIFAAKLHLVDCGRVREALELDAEIAAVSRGGRNMEEEEKEDEMEGVATVAEEKKLKKKEANKKKELTIGAARNIDQLLLAKRRTTFTAVTHHTSNHNESQASPIRLTSHERAVRRELIKSFLAANSACIKCKNCGAHSPRIRQDAYNKIFQTPLAQKSRAANHGIGVRIRPAGSLKSGRGNVDEGEVMEEINDSGWVSDDSDYEGEDDDEGNGISTMSDDEGDTNARSTVLSGSGRKGDQQQKEADRIVRPDKFMHALEIEAQVRLTWRFDPFLCSKIFGCAHSNNDDNTNNNTADNNNQSTNIHTDPWGIFFMRAIPVTPSRFRPPMVLGIMTVEHAQNVYLNKVLDLNDRLRVMLASVQRMDADDGNDDPEECEGGVVKASVSRDDMQARAISVWIELQTTVNCYIDSSKDPSATASTMGPNGIRQLLEKKEGIFRKHMMGKRVNYSCRSVISPDPYIGTNEIGLPLYFAEVLTYPTPVTDLNVSEMRKLVIRGPKNHPGACWVELPNGRRLDLDRMEEHKREALAARLLSSNGIATVGRQLRNGDMVVMNRQPTLHKPSMMAHRVRVLHDPKQKTIRMHYANCNTYNADYDGDEMNCHFPQSDIARAEAEVIAQTDLQYIVPTDGTPLRGLIQDHVDAGVKLTSKNTFIEKWEYQQLIFACLSSLEGLELIQSDVDIEMLPPTIRKPRELWTGKQVISTLLQHLRKGKDGEAMSTEILPGISVEHKTKTPDVAFGSSMMEHLVIVRDGELLRGVLDKAAFGANEFSLVHAVYEAYGPRKAGLLLNALGRLFTAYLQYYSGHSCRMEDLILTAEADKDRRDLVQRTYNIGSRAAKAWADSDGGKVEIQEQLEANADIPLKPFEAAATAAKIAYLLSGEEGANNSASLDAHMQSQLNKLASQIIKTCLPDGLAVPFPYNTFSLMTTTGAKGSKVNQSQVSCALGQQALEGRRVPRMSSGKTMPSFSAYDPNPRADGFIADRFLTGVRPQEYYFHCMAGREGLVDTAVKTSRSGYLQRCLVKHLEELKVCYDHTVRDGDGGVVQFLYGEDGIDPISAAHLDCSSSTLKFIARNHKALSQRHRALPRNSIDIAVADRNRYESLKDTSANHFHKGSFVEAKKLRFGNKWKIGAICRGWHSALITKTHSDGKHFDLRYINDGNSVSRVPVEIEYSHAISDSSTVCAIIRPAVPDPILSDNSMKRGSHLIGTSGSCISEKVAGAVVDGLSEDKELQIAMKSAGLDAAGFKRVIGAKYSAALVAPGEAVGCIAAQSIGEPSTQMTLNTFHLAGAGANVTLGIPRLREIIMTASKHLKTPSMSVPLLESVSDKKATRLTRFFTRLTLMELIASHEGISVRESLQQATSGSWERAYYVTLKLHSSERIMEAFGLQLEDIATVVSDSFYKLLNKTMKRELALSDDISVVHKTDSDSDGISSSGKISKPDKARGHDDEDEDAAGAEDGVAASRFSHKKEIASYGDMDEEDKEILADEDRATTKETSEHRHVTDDESENDDNDEESHQTDSINGIVRIDHKSSKFILQPLSVDPSTRPLLMVGLVERAAAKTLVSFRPKIERAFINDEIGRGRCLQTAGCNFEELWNLDEVNHDGLKSNDIWAVRCSYGVEAARMCIVDEIRGVFAVYGINVDPRHLTLIADYMTFDGGYKAMNRGGMADASSSFLQMSFETTANFMVEAALNTRDDLMASPSANIVLGRPIKHGTGAFDCIVK